MKRIILTAIVAAMVMMVAAPAMAGRLAYSPGYLSVTVAPGAAASQTATVSLVGAAQTEMVSFNGLGVNGLPAGWLSAPGQTALDALNTSANISVNIKVPQDAAEGTYTGTIFPDRLMSQGGRLDAGRGITISVSVVAPKCTTAPTLTGVSTDTSSINVPNNKTYNVGISGKIANPEGCTLKGAWYTLTDEYGELGGTTKITPAADGSFTASIPVQASRKGSDKDGRLYTIAIGAENEAGVGSSSTFGVTVSHDQGKK